MANAAGGKSERGDVAPSQQGRAGLRLQHALPDARVVYVSATGATAVENLAYAQRLGIWGSEDFPFANRAEFVAAIEDGGVAAMEVLARDLKSLGLYTARSLSYDGVEYDLLEHALTDEQIRIYNAYADAFQVIHNNLTAALEAANITSEAGTLNRNAKSAARSAFESTKQRFFSHLITSMMTPTLIGAIEQDRADGHSAVVQIVSTGEALMERRLAEIPTEEWSDLHVDVTPREYVGGYLMHSFPTQLFEEYSDAEGNVYSRPVHDEDGNPVQCREAVRRRDEMIEKLASLPPVGSALDQIIHHFGTDTVAEVTGRSRRIVKKTGRDGIDRLAVENRPGSANLAETQSFMDDDKRVLIFSRRRRHRPLLPRRSRGQEPEAAQALSARSRLARRQRHPGSRTDPPHKSEATAAVPAHGRQCEGRQALPVDDRHDGSTRWARSRAASARPAGQGCSVPRTISKAPMPAQHCANSTCCCIRARSKAARSRPSRP